MVGYLPYPGFNKQDELFGIIKNYGAPLFGVSQDIPSISAGFNQENILRETRQDQRMKRDIRNVSEETDSLAEAARLSEEIARRYGRLTPAAEFSEMYDTEKSKADQKSLYDRAQEITKQAKSILEAEQGVSDYARSQGNLDLARKYAPKMAAPKTYKFGDSLVQQNPDGSYETVFSQPRQAKAQGARQVQSDTPTPEKGLVYTWDPADPTETKAVKLGSKQWMDAVGNGYSFGDLETLKRERQITEEKMKAERQKESKGYTQQILESLGVVAPPTPAPSPTPMASPMPAPAARIITIRRKPQNGR